MMRAAIVIAALALCAPRAAAYRPTPPDHPPGPAEILRIEKVPDGAILTINRGSEHGVWKGWRGHLVDAKGDVPDSNFTVTDATRLRSTARVAIDADQLGQREDLRAVLEPPPVVKTRVVNIEIQDGKTVITIGAGSDAGIEKGWIGHVLDDHDRPLPGGDFTIVRVIKRSSVALVKLTADVVEHDPRVTVEPPPPP